MRGTRISLRGLVALVTIFTYFPRLCLAARNPTGIYIERTESELLLGTQLVCDYTVYNRPYSHHTTSANIQRSGVSASQYPYVLVGARSNEFREPYDIVAIGSYDDVFRPTSSLVKAHHGQNGAFWYYYSGHAFGFAPSQNISLGSADLESKDCSKRLSWHLDINQGGLVAGCERMYTGSWRKVVKYCSYKLHWLALMEPAKNHLSILRSGVWNRLPLNGASAPASPIGVGAVVSRDCCSLHAESGHEISNAYLLFAEWVNTVKGGVLVGGQRRPLELTLVDDESNSSRAIKAVKYLTDPKGLHMLIGPLDHSSSNDTAGLANQSGAVIVFPDRSRAAFYEDRPTVFSVAPARQPFFMTFLQGLWAMGARTIAVVAQRGYPALACTELPGVAVQYGMSVLWTFVTYPELHHLSNVWRLLRDSPPDIIIACADQTTSYRWALEFSKRRVDAQAIVFTTCFRREISANDPQDLDGLHYMSCLTPWASEVGNSSQITGWTSQDFLQEFRRAYDQSPHNSAVSGWASAFVLKEAMEMSNSDKQGDVAEALRNIDIETLYGRVRFDTNGLNTEIWKSMQFSPVTNSFELVFPPQVARHSFEFPMPPWRIRHCFKHPANADVGCAAGMKEGVCAKCDNTSVALWSPNAWYNVSGCLCQPNRCPPGAWVRSGQCETCPLGKYMDDVGQCQACALGHFKSREQDASCTACPLGRFANTTGSSACGLCPPGSEASRLASISCTTCTSGFYSPTAGSHFCILCDPGSGTDSESSSSCTGCEAGRAGRTICEDCLPGKFQHMAGQSACMECPLGASCTENKTYWPANDAGWWVLRQTGDQPRHVACRKEELCLQGERCKEGHTGVLCEVCLPGYYKGFTDRECHECSSWGFQVLGTFVFGVSLALVAYTLTGVAVEAAGRTKSVSDSLLKLLLNYITTFSLTSRIFNKILYEKLAVHAMSLGIPAETGPLVLTTFFSFSLLEYIWAFIPMDCVYEPSISADEQRWVDVLKAARHSEILLGGEIEHAQQQLKDLHWISSLRQMIFWLVAPMLFLGLVLVMGVVTILVHIAWNHSFLKQAMTFIDNLENEGFRRAQRGFTKAKVFLFFEAHNRRILGLYPPVRYAAQLRSGCLSFLREFAHDSQPVAVIGMFLVYPTLVQMLLSPLRCDELLGVVQLEKYVHDVHVRMSRAADLPCYETDDAIFWLSILGIAIYTVGVPVFGTIVMWRNRRNVDTHFRRTWGFVMSGYETHLNFWEGPQLLRKSQLVLCYVINMNNGARAATLLTTAMFFALLHCHFRPFDNRYNQLLDNVEFQHLVIWNLFALGIMWVQLDMDSNQLDMDSKEDEESSLFAAWSVAIVMFVLNLYFLGMVILLLLRHGSHTYAEFVLEQEQALNDMEEELKDLYDDMAEKTAKSTVSKKSTKSTKAQIDTRMELEACETKLEIFMCIMNAMTYPEGRTSIQIWLFADWAKRRLDKYYDDKPHVLCDHVNVWFCLAGKFSHRIVNENIHLKSLTQGKMPGEEVRKPIEMDRRYFLDILMETFEHIICHPAMEVFSPSLLEFVLRVGFTFDEDGRSRAAHLQDYDATKDSVYSALSIRMSEDESFSLRDPADSSRESGSRESGLHDELRTKPSVRIALGKTRSLTRDLSSSERLSQNPKYDRSTTSVRFKQPAMARSVTRESEGTSVFQVGSQPVYDRSASKSSAASAASGTASNTSSASVETDETGQKSDGRQSLTSDGSVWSNPEMALMMAGAGHGNRTAVRQEDELRGLVKEMFHPDALMTGIALQELQLNLNVLTLLHTDQLKNWVGIFEEEWTRDVQDRLGLPQLLKKAERNRRISLRSSATSSTLDSGVSGLRRTSVNRLSSAGISLRKEEEEELEAQDAEEADLDVAASQNSQDSDFHNTLYSTGLAELGDLEELTPNENRLSRSSTRKSTRSSSRSSTRSSFRSSSKEMGRRVSFLQRGEVERKQNFKRANAIRDSGSDGSVGHLEVAHEDPANFTVAFSRASDGMMEDSSDDSSLPSGDFDVDYAQTVARAVSQDVKPSREKKYCSNKSLQTIPNTGDYRVKPWELAWVGLATSLVHHRTLLCQFDSGTMSKCKRKAKENAKHMRIQALHSQVYAKRAEVASALKGVVHTVANQVNDLDREKTMLQETREMVEAKRNELLELHMLLSSKDESTRRNVSI